MICPRNNSRLEYPREHELSTRSVYSPVPLVKMVAEKKHHEPGHLAEMLQ